MHNISRYDVMRADNIYKRFYSGLGFPGQYLRAELYPTYYILSMVNDAKFSPPPNLENNGNTLLRENATAAKRRFLDEASVTSHDNS